MARIFVENKTRGFHVEDSDEVGFIESQKLYEMKTDSKEFLEVYYTTLASFYDLRYTDDLKLLIKLAQMADYNTGQVLLPSSLREKVCIELSIHTTNLSKSFKRLKEKGLIDGSRGVFTISSAIFWKGEHQAREALLKQDGIYLTIKFTI